MPTPNSSADRAAALKLFVVVNRAHQALLARARDDAESNELTITEFAVLEALYHKGDLSAGEVSRLVLLQSGSLTYVIHKLVRRRLMRRRRCAEDRRLVYLELTASGRSLMCRLWPAHARALENATAGLSLAEKRVATHLLKKLGLFAATPDREQSPPKKA